MSNIVSDNIARMVHLYSYKSDTSTSNRPSSVVEYHSVAADGKTYGILKEGTKYYIKVAPVKDTEILAEDYDYIGGITNKKRYEYDSYSNAYKQFDLKMMSINEAYGNIYDNETYKDTKPEPAEWQVKETKEMRAELDRYRTIVENVDRILTEGTNAKRPKVGVEAEGTIGNPNKTGNGDPFDKKAPVEMNQKTSSCKNAECADDTFGEKPTPAKKINKMSENEKFNGTDKTYSEKAKVDKTGKKKVNEQTTLAVNDNPDYMDMSHGTKKGSSAPFCDGENCEVDDIKEDACFDDDNIDNPKKGTGCAKCNTKPFDKKVNEETILPDEVEGFESNDDDEIGAGDETETVFGYEDDNFSNESENADEFGEIEISDDDDDISNDEDFEDEFDFEIVGDEETEDEIENDDFDAETEVGEENDDIDDIDIEDVEDEYTEPETDECMNEGVEPEIYREIEGDFRGIAKPVVLHISKFYSDAERLICVSLLKEYRKKLMQDVNAIMKGYGYRLYDTGINDEYVMLSYKRAGKAMRHEMNEEMTNYFGKHPAYRKAPFTLPDDKEIDKWGRDWNDDSAKGGEYGRSKGNSAPFDEELLVDSIVNSILKKKK